MTLQAASPPPRVLPDVDGVERAFWIGGHAERLLIAQCHDCRFLVHPPRGQCPDCGAQTEPTAVSGKGVVYSFTVNYQQFHPDVSPPYVIALIELAEQPGLRVISNVIGCDPSSVRIGLPVEVRFEPHGDRTVPVFIPAIPNE